MCGISGILPISEHAGASTSPMIIQDMLKHIAHRGPDAAGFFVDNWAMLGTVRLSILDVESSHQPMTEASGRYWIVYNGEAYNYIELREQLKAKGHRFVTHGDTEVVLKAWMEWGKDCLAKINGAFAFVIYDKLTRNAFMARDRYGKRPLFFSPYQGSLAFASEMKAFRGLKGFHFTFDEKSLASIYGHWAPLPFQTAFTGIEQVPPGSWMSIESGKIQKGSYHELDFSPQRSPETSDEALEMIRSALTEAVRVRLRSDVEVGIYLSGGVDSTIVADLAQRLGPHIPRSFSVSFDDPSLDESQFQEIAAAAIGTKHSTLRVSNGDIVRALPQAVYHGETPVFRSAFVPMFLLSQMVRDQGIKTILSGEGADEVFLGYGIFRETLLRKQWDAFSVEERKQWIARANPYLDHFSEKYHGPLLGLYQQYLEDDGSGLFSHAMRFQNGAFANRLLRQSSDPLAALKSYVSADPHFISAGPVQKAQHLEFKTLLQGYLLSTQGERQGMAHSVENRCPFLDPHVVALAGAVNLKFDDGSMEKPMLKKAFADRIPTAIMQRHKHPYRAPESAAFVAEKPDYMELLLSRNELSKLGFMEPKFVTALTRKIFDSPGDRISTRENQAFIYLLSTILLHRQFSQGLASSTVDRQTITDRLTVAVDARMGAMPEKAASKHQDMTLNQGQILI